MRNPDARITNEAPVAGHNRTKVTLACDACRKRRVKCTGALPCSFCENNGEACIYDEKSRGRRGPRPRRQPDKIVHNLAPAPKASETPVGQQKTLTGEARRVSTQRTADKPLSLSPNEEPTSNSRDLEEANEVLDSSDYGPDNLRGQVPEPAVLKSSLEEIFGASTNPSLIPDTNVVIHLLELFYRRCNANVREVVPAEMGFFHMVATKSIFSGLIYAMCACATRYSTHPMARGPTTGSQSEIEETFSKLARLSIHDWADTDRHLDYLRTYCVLIDYDASTSHGQRAWANIAISKSLLQLYRARGQPQPDETEFLERIEFYLHFNEATDSLGHGALESCVLSHAIAWSSQDSRYTQLGSEQRLLSLLRFFVRINNYKNKYNSDTQSVQPWKSNSDFRALHTEMEDYTVHFPSTPSLEDDDPCQDEIEHTITEAMCSMVCHCCDIALNMRFLPIPEPVSENAESLSTCVEFPGAPPLFILERRSRCEASAEAICRIAQDIVQGGGFFHHTALLGYCSVHAIFVLLNQLHRQPKNQQLSKIVASLKFAFTLLAAVRKFYKPAASWLDIVFRVHDTSTPLTHHRATIGEAFHSYLGRYVGVPELCFVPLVPSQAQSDLLGLTEKEGHNSPDNSVDKRDEDMNDQNDDEIQQPAWVQNYAGHLSEEIEAEEIRQHRGESPSNAISLIESSGGTAVGQDGSVSTAQEQLNPLERLHDLGDGGPRTAMNFYGQFPVPVQSWDSTGEVLEPWPPGVGAGVGPETTQPLFADFLAMGGVDFDLDAILGSDPIFGDFWPDIMPNSPSFLFQVGDKSGPH